MVRSNDVLRTAAELYGVSIEDLVGPRRSHPLVWHRHVAISAIRVLTGDSYPTIGEVVGRDHTTVMHACYHVERVEELRRARDELVEVTRGNKAGDLREEVTALRREVAALAERIGGGAPVVSAGQLRLVGG